MLRGRCRWFINMHGSTPRSRAARGSPCSASSPALRSRRSRSRAASSATPMRSWPTAWSRCSTCSARRSRGAACAIRRGRPTRSTLRARPRRGRSVRWSLPRCSSRRPSGIAALSIREILTPHLLPAPFTLGVLVGVIVVKEVLFRFLDARGARHPQPRGRDRRLASPIRRAHVGGGLHRHLAGAVARRRLGGGRRLGGALCLRHHRFQRRAAAARGASTM